MINSVTYLIKYKKVRHPFGQYLFFSRHCVSPALQIPSIMSKGVNLRGYKKIEFFYNLVLYK